MAIDFSKFDKQVNVDQLKQDVAEAAENGVGAYKEVPAGTYTGKFDKIEIGETKDGRPMMKVQFRITDGEYENSCLFMNRVLFGTKNDANMIASAVGWLESLEAEDEDGNRIDCSFQSYSQFNDIVLDVMENIDGILEYQVAYDPDAFNSIGIEDIFDVE